jgi:hypothetical protein
MTSRSTKALNTTTLPDLMRTARAELGVFAMLVDAKDEAAQRFYERFGFTLLPGEARRLVLPVGTALRQIEETKRSTPK